MSARLLRKVLKEQELNKKQADCDGKQEEQDEVEDEESDSGGHSQNIFDLLNANDDDQDLDEDDEVGNTDVLKETNNKQYHATDDAVSGPSHKQSSKKKKKKNKEVSFPAADKAEKSLDVVLESLSVDGDSAGHLASSSNSSNVGYQSWNNLAKQPQSSILKVDPKFLNAEYELRRIFGSKVVKSSEISSRAGGSRQLHGRRHVTHIHRKSALVSPSDHWPRWDGSLSMELLQTRDGIHYFRYVHSSSYSQAQRAFEAAKTIHDLNGVASILMHHPYHVESHLTMADYFKLTGEHQMAADCIAKCLYALECAWHPLFTPFLGNCRLEYIHDTNRPLFSTLFTHMKNLDRRGCHRSALEVCKLLLSLDSADPMGALFCIDYYSLRAEEHAWLEQFCEEYHQREEEEEEDKYFLWHLPNFSYSLAICRFYMECGGESCKLLDYNSDQGKATSIDLMKQALMLHPPVLKKLVAKVPLKDQAWMNILKHSFFKSEETKIPSLDHLINIYVERSYLVWRLPELQKLLRDAARLVIETLKQDDGSSEASTWACARKEAFPSEKNEYKHLLVSDFSDAVPTMPPDNLQDFMVDPAMMGRVAQNLNQDVNQQVRAPPRDLANRNTWAVFFESALPWVDYGPDNDDADGNQPNNGHQ
ncbi:hypothetical protein Dimus_025972 [Dionaea muscipula]